MFNSEIFNGSVFNVVSYSGGYEKVLPDSRSYPIPRRAEYAARDREILATAIAAIDRPAVPPIDAHAEDDEAAMLLFLTL